MMTKNVWMSRVILTQPLQLFCTKVTMSVSDEETVKEDLNVGLPTLITVMVKTLHEKHFYCVNVTMMRVEH